MYPYQFSTRLRCAMLTICVIFYLLASTTGQDSWSKWWTYDGFAGPDMWGFKWPLCKKGKYQSPIDVKPDKLLFDPSLTAIMFSSDKKLNGNLTNTGNDITLFIDETLVPHLNATAGPLQYTYHLHQIKIHFGPDNVSGSEHTINGLAFPAELHILAYNADLYGNFSQAVDSPNGIAAFSIFLEVFRRNTTEHTSFQTNHQPNEAFTMIADGLKDIQSKGQMTWISGLPLKILLPNTPQYITYDGSLTQPGCQETVTWVIFNKPIYVSKEQLEELRMVNKKGGLTEHLLIQGNRRPIQSLNNRLLRTNISYRPKTKACSMGREVFYKDRLLETAIITQKPKTLLISVVS